MYNTAVWGIIYKSLVRFDLFSVLQPAALAYPIILRYFMKYLVTLVFKGAIVIKFTIIIYSKAAVAFLFSVLLVLLKSFLHCESVKFQRCELNHLSSSWTACPCFFFFSKQQHLETEAAQMLVDFCQRCDGKVIVIWTSYFILCVIVRVTAVRDFCILPAAWGQRHASFVLTALFYCERNQ